ncbi:MAG: class II aldolase/adducin family protein [Oscillatoriales cyanobacterium RM2_1_1]|nr:class II aldolase/adducin family protein [Oscillatoriales cyanobacterium SM2_3_0]NJO47334.1 class II aldolase/adducin family protein [Oscillatoriales cyanobacterium RM2_1_1]
MNHPSQCPLNPIKPDPLQTLQSLQSPTFPDEGVTKFKGYWIKADPPPAESLGQLMLWRDRLRQLGLIGVDHQGIGFGNISVRMGPSGEFIITGTQTGSLLQLQPQHYTRVTEFDLAANSLTCVGPIAASSESLTHGAIYAHQPQVRAIIHVHHSRLWRRLCFQVPTTRAEVPYGTPQMAAEMFRLFERGNLATHKVLAMAGHPDGLITFGSTLDQAGAVLLDYFNLVD